MDKQVIISIGREFGSAGHEIAEIVARNMNINLYDRKMLDELASKYNMDPAELEKYDESPKKLIVSRNVRGFSSSLQEAVAELQFNFLKEKAASGESFVVVGRCADIVLADYQCMSTFFITGDFESKVDRIMEKYNLDRQEAISKMHRHDKKRKAYHDSYGKRPWGEAQTYDISINSSRIGIDTTIKLVEQFALERIARM